MIVEIEDRNPALIEQLVSVWENSVRATHLFLSEQEIENLKGYLPGILKNIPHLIVVVDEKGDFTAFMGIDRQKLEMLFVSPDQRGNGLGKRLVQYGITAYSINELGVNEQNPQARDFYEHMGFSIYKRTDRDEQGNPYPILYMRLIQH